ncbi:NmrA family NAD(P)-binding protein [Phytoactinopolyspora mesophila]|uniref:NAD(P)H-binding protein n=1 Tax=Phytoactinopolyspora mesophila TaxID=2650750 RepID=A0A7K3M0V0_9ACTN|nr:NAD(P)H-binding protein [Phytoactinopolyspora mesophila]NDL56916.1 NAD(P)H-binding protein [Phytoactinopolyspora mesophila]
MYAITGITGHVGGATARELLAHGAPVRALVRDAAKGTSWAKRGAEVAVVDLTDRTTLTDAVTGADGWFVMLPFIPGATDADSQRRLIDSIAGAARDSGVPHVVMLSSVGAHLPSGTGPIRWLHLLENELRSTGTVLSAIRSAHFQEKFEDVLDTVRNVGIYPNFGSSADVATPMIATRDIGAVAAALLLEGPTHSEVIDLDGPAYTERQVAEKLAAALGTTVDVVNVPRQEWVSTLEQAGVPRDFAEQVAELHAAGEDGLLRPAGDRVHQCTTEIDETIKHALAPLANDHEQLAGS